MCRPEKMPVEKHFKLIITDEFRTSKTCHRCLRYLETYTKRNGRQSYSRLYCRECNRFVDRDKNAALNILLVGTVSPRPPSMARKASEGKQKIPTKHLG